MQCFASPPRLPPTSPLLTAAPRGEQACELSLGTTRRMRSTAWPSVRHGGLWTTKPNVAWHAWLVMASKHFKRWDAEYVWSCEFQNCNWCFWDYSGTLHEFHVKHQFQRFFTAFSLWRERETKRARERESEREREGELQTALSSQKGLSICPLLLWFWVNFWHWALEFYQHHYIA